MQTNRSLTVLVTFILCHWCIIRTHIGKSNSGDTLGNALLTSPLWVMCCFLWCQKNSWTTRLLCHTPFNLQELQLRSTEWTQNHTKITHILYIYCYNAVLLTCFHTKINHSRVHLGVDQVPLFQAVSDRLFGPHQSLTNSVHTCPDTSEFNWTEPNILGVKIR